MRLAFAAIAVAATALVGCSDSGSSSSPPKSTTKAAGQNGAPGAPATTIALTGTLTKDTTWPAGDWRNSYFVPENLEASVDRAEALKEILPEGMTLPEMALRFVVSNPAVSTTIPGMRKLRHVEANIAAANAGPLPPELIDRLCPHRWERQPTEWSQ